MVDERAARADRGQTLPLVALLLAGAAGIALVVVLTGRVTIDRARAATAADAAALAGAVEGPEGAADLAARNGGVLERFVVEDGDTVVVVRVGPATATARARVGPPREAP